MRNIREVGIHAFLAGFSISLPLFDRNGREVPRKTIEACIGEGWAFYVFGSEMDNQGEIQVADHPSCIRPFSLAAGEAIRWAKTVQVPRVSAGQGSLNGSIQLVDPRMCNGRHGCYAESISSEIVIVLIHE